MNGLSAVTSTTEHKPHIAHATRDDAAHALLAVDGLGKAYGDQVALADIAFSVDAGETVGIIGPNGAGKTTLLEALAGLLPVDKGCVSSRGEILPAARRRDVMFYVPDGIRPYRDQAVVHVLSFFAGVYRRPDTVLAELVAATGLAPVLGKRVHALSKGFGRRLLLALGLLAPHDLVLMDEPFDGFDLRQTRGVAGMLRTEAKKGRTLLLAIHQLSDAERVCDRFILLSAGRLRGAGTLAELRARTGLASGSLEDIFLALT
jgi:ABC-2 type transport system ATP-binding protein